MQELFVFADWAGLNGPTLVGTLGCELLRGFSSFSFEFDKEWMRRFGSLSFGADLKSIPGVQHTLPGHGLFGCLADCLPDRWGRLLFERVERHRALSEGRPVQRLSSLDYLMGLDDGCRKGGFRFKTEMGGAFLNDMACGALPSVSNLHQLCQASLSFERRLAEDELSDIVGFQELFHTGCCLGGARPKALVRDRDGVVYIAKFASIKDRYDVGLWEHICHVLAKLSGVTAAGTQAVSCGEGYHVLLSRRFDRTAQGERVHFCSAWALLGLTDGQNAETGHGYLDLVEFVLRGCCEVRQNLKELFRRVAFNIAVGNADDHFRNHGFLLSPKGWSLSPAYDLNPTLDGYQSLLINDVTDVSSLDILIESSDEYLLDRKSAEEVIKEVRLGVSQWRAVARDVGASKREVDYFAEVFDRYRITDTVPVNGR